MSRMMFVLISALGVSQSHAQDSKQDLVAALRSLDARIAPAGSAQAKEFASVLGEDIRLRRAAANQRETALWSKIDTREEWERHRESRIRALKESLGTFPPPGDLKVRVTKTIKGDGFAIDNVIYESRPGLSVTANLYKPVGQAAGLPNSNGRPTARPTNSSPGILIIHSHHNPKTQGELQDMGMTWARSGCYVLVPDQLGHGERRQHSFIDKASYQGDFKPGRQDYYFRYNTALQLHLIGESLVGWMAYDMMRGVDLLLKQPGIDPKRIILLGSVAGGGDPCAVTAAIDPRIACAVPFNFGGPQPETKFPLPKDAKLSFNYAGGGSWESTRGLRLSTSQGFMPWVIVGSLAPRGLIYAHEFAWDQQRDPVWDRLNKIYGFYGSDRLSWTKGRGSVTGQAPESTHCNNIGAEHRKGIHPALEKWFGIPVPKEYSKRLSAEELACVPASERLQPLHKIAHDLGAKRAAAARESRGSKAAEPLAMSWRSLLGNIEPALGGLHSSSAAIELGEASAERLLMNVERFDGRDGIPLPVLLLRPQHNKGDKLPVVVGIAQDGKEGFLKNRAETIAALLKAGVAVCLPDLRGTGETRPSGDSRGRQSTSTSLSASELMLGQTLLGSRLRDLRSVFQLLRKLPNIDAKRIALWGDSFAPENPPERNLAVPLDASKLPAQAEPMGGLLVLFAALYEKDIRCVYVRGGLVSYASVLENPFLYVPHDVVVPGALTAGDVSDVAAALAPRPLRLDALVDGLNRRVPQKRFDQEYAGTHQSYRAGRSFVASQDPASPGEVAGWFVSGLK